MYYACVYCYDNSVHLMPFENKESAIEFCFERLKYKPFYDKVVRTTTIKRSGTSRFVFGSPTSLDMKGKFDKLLKKGKVHFND